MRIIKRIIIILCLTAAVFSSCGKRSSIHVISREAGSGTRSTFVKTFLLTDDNGYDITRKDADVNDSTGVMLANVASDAAAIGYASVAALSERVKAVSVDGVSPTAENVVSGDYAASRELLVVIRPDVSTEAADFISYILSSDGQSVVNDAGYVGTTAHGDYIKNNSSGRVTVAGSSSVAPLIEILAEKYENISGTEIELQQSDSSSGIRSLAEGICDIALSSRDLTEDERDMGLIPCGIGYDALAIIVNPRNNIGDLSKEQITQIFNGDIKYWYEVTE